MNMSIMRAEEGIDTGLKISTQAVEHAVDDVQILGKIEKEMEIGSKITPPPAPQPGPSNSKPPSSIKPPTPNPKPQPNKTPKPPSSNNVKPPIKEPPKPNPNPNPIVLSPARRHLSLSEL